MYINLRPCLQEVHDMTLKVEGQTVWVGKKLNCLNKIDAENKSFCYRIRCEFVVNQEVWLRTDGSLFPQTTVWRKLQHHFPGVKFQKPVWIKSSLTKKEPFIGSIIVVNTEISFCITNLQFSSQPYHTFSCILGMIFKSPFRTACRHSYQYWSSIQSHRQQ